MTPKSVAGLFLLFALMALTVRTVFGALWGRNRAARILVIAGMAVVCPMVIYEALVGWDFGTYPEELAAFLFGVGTWVVGWIWAVERKSEVRSRLRISELKVDRDAIDENPNWVREQLLEHPVGPDWERLLPLVEAGWNGGFAWLTPQLVREQAARKLPATADTAQLPPPE